MVAIYLVHMKGRKKLYIIVNSKYLEATMDLRI
jgi:hypothetical protein